jgi:hypothetical protein
VPFPSSFDPDRSSLARVLAFAAVAALALVAYLPSFSVPFQFDDYGAIVENANERREAGMEGLNWVGSRPLSAATFELNFRFGGDDPFGYHVVNVIVHVLACLAVFGLALALWETPRLRASPLAPHRLGFATAAVFVFACHPLQTQGVTYIVQRMASMGTLFYVAAVFFYVRARVAPDLGRPALPLFVAAVLCALSAWFSKENTVSLPVMLLLAEAALFDRRNVHKLAALLPTALVAVAAPILWRLVIGWNDLPGADELSAWEKIRQLTMRTFSPAELRTGTGPLRYFLTQALVVPRYLRLAVLPVGLNVDHDVPLVHGVTPAVLGGLLLLGALVALGLVSLRRRPLFAFGLLWIFVALSVESSFLPINDVMMEHRMYLAMPGVGLLAAGALMSVQRRRPRTAALAAAALVALLPVLTYARNGVWRTPVTLWSDAVRKSPGKARTQLNAGVAFHMEGRLEEAVRHYCRTLNLNPSSGIAELADENLEIALAEQGKLDAALDEILSQANVEVQADGSVQVVYDLAKVACR